MIGAYLLNTERSSLLQQGLGKFDLHYARRIGQPNQTAAYQPLQGRRVQKSTGSTIHILIYQPSLPNKNK